jgi:hypothetical protein
MPNKVDSITLGRLRPLGCDHALGGLDHVVSFHNHSLSQLQIQRRSQALAEANAIPGNCN